MSSWVDIDLNYGPTPGSLSPSKLSITPNDFIVRVIHPAQTIKVPSTLLISARSAVDKPTVTNPAKLFFIQLEYYKSKEDQTSSTKSTMFLQTTNVPGYDLTQPNAHTTSPAAVKKAQLVEKFKALVEAGKLAASSSTTTTPSSTSTSTSTTTTTTTTSSLAPTTSTTKPTKSTKSTATTTQQAPPPTTTPTHLDIINKYITTAPPSPTTTSLRIACLQQHPELQSVFKKFVETDQLMSVQEFWSLNESTFNRFRAETEQAPIPTAMEVINQMSEFNYSYTKPEQQQNNNNNNNKNESSTKQKTTQTVKQRAKEISIEIQNANQLQAKRLHAATTPASILIKNDIDHQLKTDTTTTTNGNKSKSNTSNESTSTTTTTPSSSSLTKAAIEIRNTIHSQQLLGDELGWGRHQARTSIFDPTLSKQIDVEVKEQLWLANNVIHGLNLLGQAEVAINEQKLQEEKKEYHSNPDTYSKVKSLIYKDEMTTQLESRTHGNPSSQLQPILNPTSTSLTSTTTPPTSLLANKTELIKSQLLPKVESSSTTTTTTPSSTSTTSTTSLSPLLHQHLEPQPLTTLNLESTKYSQSQSNLTLHCRTKHPYQPHDQNNTNKQQQLQQQYDLFSLNSPFMDDNDGKIYQYQRHELSTKMLLQINNTTHHNINIPLSKDYIANINDGIYENNNNTNQQSLTQSDSKESTTSTTINNNNNNTTPAIDIDQLWDQSQQMNKKRKTNLFTQSNQQQLSTSLSSNDYELVQLNDIMPISTSLESSLPNNNTNIAIFTATATKRIPHQNPKNFGQGLHQTNYTGTSIIAKSMIDDNIPKEIEQIFKVTKHLASLYWSTTNKTIKPRPGTPYQEISTAVIAQLTLLKDKLINLSDTVVTDFKAKFSQERQPHLVLLLGSFDLITDAILQHYNQIVR